MELLNTTAAEMDIGLLIKERLDPKETVLVHGTSVEAILAFLKRGLLTGEKFSRNGNKRYLHCAPNKNHFIGHELYDILRDLSWEDDILHTAKNYAQIFAVYHFYAVELGDTKSDLPMILLDDHKGSVDALVAKFTKRGRSSDEALQFMRNLRQRRGVIFGVNSSIFELRIREDSEAPGEYVKIYVPKGFPLTYVNGIVPLGDLERNLLMNYVQSLR